MKKLLKKEKSKKNKPWEHGRPPPAPSNRGNRSLEQPVARLVLRHPITHDTTANTRMMHVGLALTGSLP
jgi:hypothetical protein